MTREKLSEILDRIDHYREIDRSKQKALRSFCEVFAPSSYAPILEDYLDLSYIDGVCIGFPELKEHLEYYKADDCHTGYIGDIEYDLHDREQFIDFVMKIIEEEK